MEIETTEGAFEGTNTQTDNNEGNSGASSEQFPQYVSDQIGEHKRGKAKIVALFVTVAGVVGALKGGVINEAKKHLFPSHNVANQHVDTKIGDAIAHPASTSGAGISAQIPSKSYPLNIADHTSFKSVGDADVYEGTVKGIPLTAVLHKTLDTDGNIIQVKGALWYTDKLTGAAVCKEGALPLDGSMDDKTADVFAQAVGQAYGLRLDLKHLFNDPSHRLPDTFLPSAHTDKDIVHGSIDHGVVDVTVSTRLGHGVVEKHLSTIIDGHPATGSSSSLHTGLDPHAVHAGFPLPDLFDQIPGVHYLPGSVALVFKIALISASLAGNHKFFQKKPEEVRMKINERRKQALRFERTKKIDLFGVATPH